MARTQATRRQTRKGSKKLADDETASQEMFKYPETIRGIAKFQAARAKMTEEEKAERNRRHTQATWKASVEEGQTQEPL